MDRVIRYIIGCNSPRIDEDIVEHLGTPCLAETELQGSYQQIRGKESVICRITLRHSGRILIIPFGTHPPIILQCCLQSQSVWLFPLETLHLCSRIWEAHPRQLDKTPRAISQEETLQLRPLVGARAVGYRLRDGVVDSQGSIPPLSSHLKDGGW